MIKLNAKFRLTRDAVEAANLTSHFDEEDLSTIGRIVLEGYTTDEESRADWKRRYEKAFNLALQLQESKSFPWPGASNVKFPLVTIAALQWHSRAYPLLVQGPNIVKMHVNGADPQGERRQSADRVAAFMSYQLLEDSSSWEEETDRALLQVPIIGCAFKKTYYSADAGKGVSELVPAIRLVMNYWAKSTESCSRKTHIIPLTRNDVHTRVMAEVFANVLACPWFTNLPTKRDSSAARDTRTGTSAPAFPDFTTPFEFLEQHVEIDLDGDGYAEPYIITVEQSSGTVCRIVANFEWDDILWKSERKYQIVRIRSAQYFTKIPFIPSPDGGIYDIGFGLLLGPLNQSVDSLINQLIDAGTLSTTAGGFLGRGVKMRGGEQSFRPFGWTRVDSTGEDLSKGIFPLPVREPSHVLFNLLSLLIDYTNRISGSTDIMVGENPGQNTPAETSRLMAEQGAKINSAIFKRVWRGLKNEFQKLYIINRRHVPSSVTNFGEESGWVTRADFAHPEEAVRPAADPNLSSDTQSVQKALMVKQQSMGGGYDKDVVERQLLRALRVEDMNTLYPGLQKAPPPPHPKVALEQAKGQHRRQEKQADHQAAMQEKILDLHANRDRNAAEIELISAQIAQIIAEIGAAQAASQVKAFEAQIGALKAVDESQRGYLELLQKGQESANGGNGGRLPGMGGAPGNPGAQGAPPGGNPGTTGPMV